MFCGIMTTNKLIMSFNKHYLNTCIKNKECTPLELQMILTIQPEGRVTVTGWKDLFFIQSFLRFNTKSNKRTIKKIDKYDIKILNFCVSKDTI